MKGKLVFFPFLYEMATLPIRLAWISPHQDIFVSLPDGMATMTNHGIMRFHSFKKTARIVWESKVGKKMVQKSGKQMMPFRRGDYWSLRDTKNVFFPDWSSTKGVIDSKNKIRPTQQPPFPPLPDK